MWCLLVFVEKFTSANVWVKQVINVQKISNNSNNNSNNSNNNNNNTTATANNNLVQACGRRTRGTSMEES